MSIVTILSILVSSMIVYAAPLIFKVSEEHTQNTLGLLTLVWKESWLWEPSQVLSLTTFEPTLEV